MSSVQQVIEALTGAQVQAIERVIARWKDADVPSFTENVPSGVNDLVARGFFEVGGGGAFAVPYGRMWLLIETDGYTHS